MRRQLPTDKQITRAAPMKAKRKLPARKTTNVKAKRKAAKKVAAKVVAKTRVKAKTKAASRAPKQAKEIVQFAPNFTAYVLPPATVCLYSESRKFFLHGELYCAIAETIGKKGKETQAIVNELSRTYPVDQVQE